MDTKVLYVVAVIVAAISGGYYFYSGKAKKLEVGVMHLDLVFIQVKI